MRNVVVFLLLAAVAGACGGEAASGINAYLADADSTRAEAVEGQEDADTDVRDWKSLSDKSGSDGYVLPEAETSGLSGLGEPCAENAECESGWCLTGDERSICTQTCVEECLQGWRCVTMYGLGPDVVTLCVPLAWLLCDPCESDDECGGGSDRCLPVGTSGTWCAAACTAQDDCPAGYECKDFPEGAQCVPVTGSCVCTPELLNTTRDCTAANEWGTCAGIETCTGPAGWEGCTAPEAAEETCNSEDDDCDGKIDEGLPEEICMVGNFWGSCPGSTECMNGKKVCLGIEATMEVCDGLDNDCDDDVDEGFPAIGTACDSDDPDQCAAGVWECSPDGMAAACIEAVEAPELCDGMDNDCDGGTDEDNAAGCVVYFSDGDADGFGIADASVCACAASDAYPTAAAGDCDDSDSSVHPGAKETCDQQDEDCDAVVDEEAVGCTLWYQDSDGDGFGQDGSSTCACAASGQHTAAQAGDCLDSDADVFPSNTESCDGKDNDCDWLTDEPDAEGCSIYFPDEDEDGFGPEALGLCLCEPTLENNIGVGGDCDDTEPGANPDAAELCDAKDNDCNGQKDDPGADGCVMFYKDEDADGFGTAQAGFCYCDAVPPYTALWGGDCNDSNPQVNPASSVECVTDVDCCAGAEACFAGQCIPIPYPCLDGDGCINDTACEEGTCVPFDHPAVDDSFPGCTRPYNPGIFLPSVQCKWETPPPGDPFPANKQVLSTAMVADFDFEGIKESVRPSVVFTSYSGSDGGFPASSSNGIVRILDGQTCEQIYVITAATVVGASPPAIGDIDLAPDGRPEIVSFAQGGGMVAFKFDPAAGAWNLLWHSTKANGQPSDLAAGEHRWNGPAIYDLDGDGTPEILMGAVVHNNNGKIVAENLGYYPYSQGHLGVAADVDLDGKTELVMGNGVYEFKGTSWQKESYFKAAPSDGFVAVADFGAFPVPGLPAGIAEIVVISSGQARVMKLSGETVFGPYALPSFPVGTTGGHGGPPTVGDFDGDGKPEFALAGKGSYTVFDFDCAATPTPWGCQAPGILWAMQTQDYSSSVTGSSVFDFEADGLAEAIYADECYTRVYSGLSGEVLFSQPRTSCTWYENPVVADVDGDFKSEVIVGSNTNCGISCPGVDPMFRGIRCKTDKDCPGGPGSCKVGYCRCAGDADCGPADSGFACTDPLPNTPGTGKVCRTKHWGAKSGIVVYRDQSDAWVDSRRIWNQHAYFVTNIDENGHVPHVAKSPQNWQAPGLNNFRQNVQGDFAGESAPDLTVEPGFLTLCTEQGLDVPVAVCNRGAAPVDSGVAVAFFLGPAGPGGKIQCLQETGKQLFPGECEPMSCTVALFPGSAPADITVFADFGGEKGEHTECFESNNSALYPAVDCGSLW